MPIYRLLTSSSLIAILALSATMSAPAAAQDAPLFAPSGEFELLAPAFVSAGQRVSMTVVAYHADGTPMVGLKAKTSSDSGACGGWSELGAGQYTFWFDAPTAESSQTVNLLVKGKTASRVPFSLSQRVDVVPNLGTNVDVNVTPQQVVLGQSTDASVTFSLSGAGHLGLTADDILVETSSGTITNVTHMGDGRFVARFTPPAVKYPHLAIITVALKANPDSSFGHTVIPMIGQVPYPITAAANSTVMLTVDGRTFGPVIADAQGKASVPIEVAPGQERAVKTIVADGKKLEESVDLRIPETRRVALFPISAGLGADGKSTMVLRALVVQKNGDPDEQANLQFDLGAHPGALSAAKHIGQGVYESHYSAPTGTDSGQITVHASLGGSTIQGGDFTFQVVGELPATMTLTGDPRLITDNTAQLRLFIELHSHDGAGVEGQSVALYPAGAEQKGDVSDLHSGMYQATFVPTTGNVEIMATVRVPSAGNGVAHVFLMPMSPVVNNDGTSTDLLLVVTTDAQGYPVANVTVEISAEGDGSVDNSVTTDANGLASVLYKSSRTAGIIELQASSAGVSTSTAIVQAPSGDFLAVSAPGSESAQALADRWMALTGILSVPREGADSTAVAAVLLPDRVVPAESIVIEVSPMHASVGEEISVVARVRDGDGAGLSGHSLNDALNGQSGVLSKWIDNQDGSYSSTYVVAVDASGTQTITVASGAVTGEISVVIDDVEGGAVIPSRKARVASSDTHNHRVSVGLVSSSLAYRQSPYTSTGPLLPNTVEFGQNDASSAAHPVGLAVSASGTVSDSVYYDASIRVGAYTITAPEFGDTLVMDTTTSGHAHIGIGHAFSLGGTTLTAGLRGGLAIEDYLMWSLFVDDDTGAQSIEYMTILPFGSSVAVDVGMDFTDWSIGGSFTRGLAYFTNPHVNALALHGVYDINDQWFVKMAVDSRARGIELIGQDTGTLYGDIQDSTNSLELAVGMKF